MKKKGDEMPDHTSVFATWFNPETGESGSSENRIPYSHVTRFAGLPDLAKTDGVWNELADWKEAHGEDYRAMWKPCPTCNGRGKVSRSKWLPLYHDCPTCHGDGEVAA